jgi:uncharacterized protein YdeI (YjbR/CyaY-like superfamily)
MASLSESSATHESHGKFGFPIYHAETRAQVRAWFERNHDAAVGVWLCSWRSPTGKPRCPYAEAVEEALCFGWIDSTASNLDEKRGIQLFTPRKPKSSWTRLNRRRVADMEAAGLMTDAGRRVVEIAKANGWWTIYEQVEDLIEPDGLRTALDENDAARAAWNGFPPSARKFMLWWVVSAAKQETQAQRIAAIVAKAAVGERAQS